MIVRQLNAAGLQEFEDHVNRLRSGIAENIPTYLLDSADFSTELNVGIEVQPEKFTTRYEMGLYLEQALNGKDIQRYLGNQGFWSWLALFWFDQLCPLQNGNQRKPSMPYNYILSKKYNHRPRHAVFSTWQLVHLYGEKSKFLLCNEMQTRGELAEQLLARQGILTCRGVMELASELYLDIETGRFKRGAAARKSAGCVTRFIDWLQQIELTYDLYSSEMTDLRDLLPSEFDKFLET